MKWISLVVVCLILIGCSDEPVNKKAYVKSIHYDEVCYNGVKYLMSESCPRYCGKTRTMTVLIDSETLNPMTCEN